MSQASIARARPSRVEEVVALVAGERAPSAVAEILVGEQLRLEAFDCGESLLTRAGDRPPAVIVLWVDDATAALRALVEPLARGFRQAPVVLVCPAIDRRAVRAALAAGACGVVLHEQVERSLGPCLRAVRAGQLCLPRRDWQEVEPRVLSSREKQVLGLVVMGYMNSQIADQLFLAESTVKSHLSSAFNKLGVRSRHEAVARILDPQAGLGVGILLLGGEPLQAVPSETS
jgi:DNA-binding NarL/FixJ family response regulator